MKHPEVNNPTWIWWKHGIIYHIYPRSFFDSNNDGIGDINGIIARLDYFVDLGVDALWLSPVFTSPQIDFGYDVADHKSIDPIFGTKKDLDQLIKKAHKRNIKVILDLVLNHTSNQHSWFLESKSSKENPKRNWFLWETPKEGKRPNNWKNAFGGPAWRLDEATGEYYYHSFLKEQPDLNWRNKEVQKAMFRMIEYWLNQGIDGFRLDVINFIVKDRKLRNNPSIVTQLLRKPRLYTRDRPKALKILKSLRELLDQYPEKVSIGEIYMLPPGNPELPASYLGNGTDSLHLAFDFSLTFQRWSAKQYARIISKWSDSIPKKGWPSWVLSNHDLHRSHNRKRYRLFKNKKARLEALLLLTLKGTPFIYYGQEIGMENGKIPRNKIRDPLGKKFWPIYTGRDKARTPMQWSSEPFAGFSTVEPWLPVNKDYKLKNVTQQQQQSDSLYNFYKSLIGLRRNLLALTQGKIEVIPQHKSGVLYYSRTIKSQHLLIMINFTAFKKRIKLQKDRDHKLLISTDPSTDKKYNPLMFLNPFEGIIVQQLPASVHKP